MGAGSAWWSFIPSFPGSILPPSRLHLTDFNPLKQQAISHINAMRWRVRAVDGVYSSEIIGMKLNSYEECDGLKWS